MNWIAYMKDGSIIRETEEFPFDSLNFKKVERFRLTESGSNMVIPFSSDSGILRFTNLDLTKLKELQGKEKITLEFDKDYGFFRMDKKSLDLYQSIILKDENSYYFIEFDQTGEFNINGEKLFTGFEIEDELIEFRNSPPYNNLIQYKNGFSEIKMVGNKPINKNDKVVNYNIGYTKKHTYNGIEFDLKYEIVYDLVNRYVMLNFIVISDKDISGKIFLSYGGKTSRIPIRLTSGSPMQTKRVLNVLG